MWETGLCRGFLTPVPANIYLIADELFDGRVDIELRQRRTVAIHHSEKENSCQNEI